MVSFVLSALGILFQASGFNREAAPSRHKAFQVERRT